MTRPRIETKSLNESSLDRFAALKLAALDKRTLRRALLTTERGAHAAALRGGTRLVSFACNDYLGLSAHPDVIAASVEATRRFGTGAGASRLITGNHPLYGELERRLAAIKGTDRAVVFGSGYLANIGLVPLVAGPPDLIVMDELCHSCLLAGAQLSRAHIVSFAHNDVSDARRSLQSHRARHRHCLLVTEGVFSMDGDLAPLPDLAQLARDYDCWLLSDDAHGLGVVGGGRGSSFAHGAQVDVPLQMGTLSKAVGGYGGYVCCSEPVAELLVNRARSLVYSTGLPPGTVAAASEALRILSAAPERAAKILANARKFTGRLGLPPAQSAIVPLVLRDSKRTLAASAQLEAAGFLVPAIRPPTVPPGAARLRFAFSAEHTPEDIDALADAVERIGARP